MLALQSEANVCRNKCNLKNPQLLIAQDFQQPRTQLRETCALEEWGRGGGTAFVSYIGMPGFLSEILGVE